MSREHTLANQRQLAKQWSRMLQFRWPVFNKSRLDTTPSLLQCVNLGTVFQFYSVNFGSLFVDNLELTFVYKSLALLSDISLLNDASEVSKQDTDVTLLLTHNWILDKTVNWVVSFMHISMFYIMLISLINGDT